MNMNEMLKDLDNAIELEAQAIREWQNAERKSNNKFYLLRNALDTLAQRISMGKVPLLNGYIIVETQLGPSIVCDKYKQEGYLVKAFGEGSHDTPNAYPLGRGDILIIKGIILDYAKYI